MLIEISQVISAIVAVIALAGTLITLAMKGLCSLKEIRTSLTTKRIIIGGVSLIVGSGFLSAQNDIDAVRNLDSILPISIITLFAMIVWVNYSTKGKEFLSPWNVILLLGAGFIIWEGPYFNLRYQQGHKKRFENMMSLFKFFYESYLFKGYFCLILITTAFWGMSRIIINQGSTLRGFWAFVYNTKNLATLIGVFIYWMGLDGIPVLRSGVIKFLVP